MTYFEFTKRFLNENAVIAYVGSKNRKENGHFNNDKVDGNEGNFVHLKIDHTVDYSLGDGIYTNRIESFWAILKRGVYGVFHNISVEYMQKFVDEFGYRLNHRNNKEAVRDSHKSCHEINKNTQLYEK